LDVAGSHFGYIGTMLLNSKALNGLLCAALPVLLLTAQQQDPSFAPVEDQIGLPRVLLIGDSISMGYTIPVRVRLQGKANVHRIPENGGPSSNGTANIDSWLKPGNWDVIHFNFGLHDLKRMEDGNPQVSLMDYERNLRVIVQRLQRTSARLIWATTTPVPAGDVSPPRKPVDVPAYNAAARRVMESEGVAIDDLYEFVLPHQPEWQRPVNVHFTDAGSEALAQQVADVILRQLRERQR
jgi:lysophospholipase L1-like esterase